MPRRPDETVTLCCPLTDAEQDVAATMMQMTGIVSEANLVRLGLWHLARHLDVPVGNLFALRKARGAKPRRLADRQLSVLDVEEER